MFSIGFSDHAVVHALDLLPHVVQFGLPHGLGELALKLSRHPPDLADRVAESAQRFGEILRADDNQRHGADHHDLTPTQVQHDVVSNLSTGMAGSAVPWG